MNFSSIRQKAKTQIFTSVSFFLWAMAALVHLVHNFGREKDSLAIWIIEILIASLCAAGFGWHLNKAITLTEMEKRGKSASTEEFGKI